MTHADPAPVLSSFDGAVARLVLNRPAAGNSLAMSLVQALSAELRGLAPREDIKTILLSANGGRIFCAGHDLNEFSGEPDPEFLERDFAGLTALMQQIMDQPQIIIAMVDGVATAAGCELVAACDLALASTHSRFAVPGVNIGFWCHTPQVQLSRNIGRKQAMMMLATGRLFPASHALTIGLVNELHEPDDLEAASLSLAAQISQKASSVLRLGKKSFNQQSEMSLEKAYGFARQQAFDNLQLDDAKEGISAFLQKRDPHWVI